MGIRIHVGEVRYVKPGGPIYTVRCDHQATLNKSDGLAMAATGTEDSLDKVTSEVQVCTKCRLSQTRKQAVPGEGSRNASVMFVGEAPGEQEDVQGRPFVGAAGKLLTELLQSIDLRREDVYITNIVKCRPPNNRPPRKDESAACRPYLDRQVSLLPPKVVCPMGNSAIHALIDTEQSVTTLHGIPFEDESMTYFPMYHPAAALYTFSLRKVMDEDFRKLRALLDSLTT
jgi:uracil-DNA glycosylase family 4